MKRILIVVDMQRDFIDGSLGTNEAVAIVPRVIDKIKEYKNAGFEIVFTRDTHGENYLETNEGKHLPVEHCIKGTKGWQLNKEIDILAKMHRVFDKPAFGSVELMNYLLDNTYDEVELCGLCTDICVISNALLAKAALPEARIIVDSTCSAGVTVESHDRALETMKMCQIEVR